MAKIIAITNQKGGVGKTTTTINLAACLAALKSRPRVLLIDLDPQGNATMGNGINKHDIKVSSLHVLLEEADILESIINIDKTKLRLIPANHELTGAEVLLAQKPQGAYALKNALSKIEANFDYILLDCPPSLNMLTVNALTAANSVLIPVQCEYYALEGISALLETLEQIKQTTNPNLAIEGVLRTMFDSRNNLALEVSEQLEKHFGDVVFKSIIPRSVRLAEAPSFGEPINMYDPSSKGALAYAALAAELVKRNKVKKSVLV